MTDIIKEKFYPSQVFVGRDDVIHRFRARMNHYNVFLYEGIAGVGKTATLLRLAEECQTLGMRHAVYLAVQPGEGIGSILARTEGYFSIAASGGDRQGDPYSRLIGLLHAKQAVLLLDGMHRFQKDDIPILIRSARQHMGEYRILFSSRTDIGLSVRDRGLISCEKLPALSAESTVAIARHYGASRGVVETLRDASKRGGGSAHPLILVYLVALCKDHRGKTPHVDILRKYPARSQNSFRALCGPLLKLLEADERLVLEYFAKIQLPIDLEVAEKAFGKAIVNRLCERALLSRVGNRVNLHRLAAQTVLELAETEVVLPAESARLVAQQFKERAQTYFESYWVLRASELLAESVSLKAAVNLLATVWEMVRDMGFLEGYLKTLASFNATGAMGDRVHLLSARARMRKSDPGWAETDMLALAQVDDKWTQERAYAALVYIYNATGEHGKVLPAYNQLQAMSTASDLVTPAGIYAAGTMVRLGKSKEAEVLCDTLIKKLKGKKQPGREASVHRLQARICAMSGRPADAIKYAEQTSSKFIAAGDLYHAATAQGFIGDLYRESGQFELARKAFNNFQELAKKWGDRDLIQIADLSNAWVLLDIGDLIQAEELINDAEENLSAASSKRLKRYLAGAKAMLMSERGHHKQAAEMLGALIEPWETSGQRAIADLIRASWVRSLVACGELDKAEKIVAEALKRLDSKTASSRVASFLREGALIKLHRGDTEGAINQFADARKRFSKNGNRREEAATLYRMSRAAVDIGDLDLAKKSAEQAIKIADDAGLVRVRAHADETMARVALARGDAAAAVTCLRGAHQQLRTLGDEIGALHLSERLLRAMLSAGELTAAKKHASRLRDHAEKLGVQEVRLRTIVFSGAIALRQHDADKASSGFRELPNNLASPLSTAVMWRFGQALAAYNGDDSTATKRQHKWVEQLERLPEARQATALIAIKQLHLPPHNQGRFFHAKEERTIGTEDMGWLRAEDYQVFADGCNDKVFIEQRPIKFTANTSKLFWLLLTHHNKQVSFADLYEKVLEKEPSARGTIDKPFQPLLTECKRHFGEVRGLSIVVGSKGIKLTLPSKAAWVLPTAWVENSLTDTQRSMIEFLTRYGAVPMQLIQDSFQMTRTVLTKDLAPMLESGIVETVREGRSQSVRLKQ